MRQGTPKTVFAVAACALSLMACDVTYVVAPQVDAGTPDTTASRMDAGPPPKGPLIDAAGLPPGEPGRVVLGAAVSCPEWGQGERLRTPSLALATLATVLWGDDPLMRAEADKAYAAVTATTGDTYCVARHMLTRPRAADGLAAFYKTWLGLDAITPKDVATYGTPQFDGAVKSAAAFAVDATLGGDQRFGRLFGALRPIEFAEGVRPLSPTSVQYQSLAGAGLLSEAGVLAAWSGSESWPASRGLFLRRTMLCEDIPPEPAGARNLRPDPSVPFREWHEGVVDGLACRACHDLLDPIGYVLDVFDAVGRAHSLDRNGQRFELAGKLALPSGDTVPIASPADLGKVLASSIDAKSCYLQSWLDAFQRARGLPQPQADAVRDVAVRIEAQNGFMMTEAIANAARLSFAQQP